MSGRHDALSVTTPTDEAGAYRGARAVRDSVTPLPHRRLSPRTRTLGVVLTPTDPPPYDVPPAAHEVVILPVRIEGEQGVYRDAVLILKKQLAERGIDAAYMHDADHQLWEGMKGSASSFRSSSASTAAEPLRPFRAG